ncbi:MAG: PIN domain-containing protein, partial [Solirubrobacteraceae bacterium]
DGVLRRPAKVGLPWPSLLGFMRLMGNPHAVRRPIPLRRSRARMESLLALPNTWIPLPTDRHQEILAELLAGESRSDIVNDAHLAALAIEHGLTLCSADRDFARFQGVRWENPLRP